jgi:hypothetical protein
MCIGWNKWNTIRAIGGAAIVKLSAIKNAKLSRQIELSEAHGQILQSLPSYQRRPLSHRRGRVLGDLSVSFQDKFPWLIIRCSMAFPSFWSRVLPPDKPLSIEYRCCPWPGHEAIQTNSSCKNGINGRVGAFHVYSDPEMGCEGYGRWVCFVLHLDSPTSTSKRRFPIEPSLISCSCLYYIRKMLFIY